MKNSNVIEKTISRRQLLSTAAIGGVAMAGATVLGSASAGASVFAGAVSDEYWNQARIDRYLCSQIHYAKSVELSGIVASSNLDESEKSLALRTAHCPSCGVHIQPGAGKAGFSINA